MDKDTFFRQKQTLNFKGKLLILDKPVIMGIININDNSFFEGSRLLDISAILRKVAQFLAEGAVFVDIGASSSKPGSLLLTAEEELSVLLPVITEIAKQFPEILISVDTVYAAVAQASIVAGAHLINDISAGNMDPKMFETIAALQVPYVLMHMRGRPENMQHQLKYEDIIAEMMYFFSEKLRQLRDLGVKDVILDLGFGFGKSMEDNFKLLHQMAIFDTFQCISLIGISRKSMIYNTLGTDANVALNGTSVLHTLALCQGAKILRVHDVKEAQECITLVEQYQRQA